MVTPGLAYVKLEDEKSLTEALKEVERTHMDRTVKIVRATPLSEKPPREPREPREKRPEGDKPQGDRPQGDRPARTRGDRPRGDRPRGERPRGDRPSGDRPRGERTRGDRKVSGDRKKVYKPKHNDENSIYIGNLSFKTTEMKLGRHFESYGDIKDVRIVEDDQERSRGFGYVEFESVD